MKISTTPAPLPTSFFVRDEHGKRILPGSEVTSFRGEKMTFVSVSRPASLGHSAKVIVIAKNGGWREELYATVFNLTVRSF